MSSVARSVVIGVSLLALGALLGIGYLLLDEVAPDGGSLQPRILEQAALREFPQIRRALEEEIPALRREVRELRGSVSALTTHMQSVVAAASNIHGRELYRPKDSASERNVFMRDKSFAADPPNLERLGVLQAWNDDAELRRKWVFTGERDIVREFGAPDEIHPDTAGEWWIYWVAGSGKPTSKYSLQMSAGRLVGASYFEDPDATKR